MRFQNDPGNSLSLGAGQVSAIFEDHGGTLWVGTEGGLSEWRPAINGFVTYLTNPTDRTSLVNNRINAIVQDASGVLWLATHAGLSAWNYFSDTFKYYSSAERYLESNLVTSVAESSDGVIWVGTYGGGLSKIDVMSDTVRHYRHDRDDALSLPDDRVMAVHVDYEDIVWVGTRDGGLARLQADGEGFVRFVHDASDDRSLSGNAITRIYRELDGTLWVGVFDGGLNRMQPVTSESHFQRFQHDPEDPTSLSSNRVLTIYQDRSGSIWFGTEGAGLNRLESVEDGFERFDLEQKRADKDNDSPTSTPWEIHESRDGTMWIGTLSQGLLRWSLEDRRAGKVRFDQFSVREGLSSQIFGIVESTPGELWLSSSNGLFLFEVESGAVRKFDRKNGLRGNEFNHSAKLRSRSGRLVFGSTAGLVGFFPGELPSNSRPPSVELLARSRTADIARTGSGRSVPTVQLQYFDTFVSFEFVALDFVSSDKNEYRYRLAGLEDEWIEVRGFRRAIYSSLTSGNYTFEVQASNNDGVWNRAGANIEVIVVPPPWSTWWAYVSYVIVALAVVGWFLNRQRRKQMAEAKNTSRLEKLLGERTSELAERNDELMALNVRLEKASVTDALTELHNRRYVNEYMEAETSMLRRVMFEEDGNGKHSPDSPRLLFLMMIDLDGFKLINDTFGHLAGDTALIEVKDRLIASCRKSDSIVRWGGDEFLIIGQARTYEGAEIMAGKVRASLADPQYDLGDGRFGKLSASIGISPIPFVEGKLDFATWEQVSNIADLGTYLAKSNGRDAWVSIAGTDQLTADEMKNAKDRLADLVDLGKLRVESSLRQQLRLRFEPVNLRA